ncbi:hypothetical protein [Corynebacterium pyruviciproducens]|uniref:Uncharacterized protein n=2 Tax=Corynebacterium pyruviciproducens TaxID=598660 RepID=S2ZID2_9CORY|nr:hypothetical protein [Corynebacterium pyruviciproducens]EPD69807.1 hypothetical protein HMPREF1219_01139 [Corynebacterium pyruviciproducens ATCC BAA-1742]MDH4658297.1 hypothetical protein [Corynebacterium pyruviciproducens]MDK6565837.1 hypothetical protein [Corynebacterium pyruviciproducens]MDK7215042.1 hypothetical protein [Corynebacterium pyruviciproducens]WOT02796.1 hypothetical protein CYJ47_03215 [Corynebacterium pyruviciproducens]
MRFYTDGKQNLLRRGGEYYERYIPASDEERRGGYWRPAPSGDFLITWGTRYSEIGEAEAKTLSASLDAQAN